MLIIDWLTNRQKSGQAPQISLNVFAVWPKIVTHPQNCIRCPDTVSGFRPSNISLTNVLIFRTLTIHTWDSLLPRYTRAADRWEATTQNFSGEHVLMPAITHRLNNGRTDPSSYGGIQKITQAPEVVNINNQCFNHIKQQLHMLRIKYCMCTHK